MADYRRSTEELKLVDEFNPAANNLVRLREYGAPDEVLRVAADKVQTAANNLVTGRMNRAKKDTETHQANLSDLDEALNSRPSSPSGLSELFDRDSHIDSDREFLPLSPVSPAESAGPVSPVSPAASAGPLGPAASAGPVGPAASAGPVGPVGPAASASSSGILGHFGPLGPFGPHGPFGPSHSRKTKGRKHKRKSLKSKKSYRKRKH